LADNGSLAIWDCIDGREIKRIETGDDTARCLAWSPDGKLLAVDGSLFEAATGRALGNLLAREARGVSASAFTIDSRRLAVGDTLGVVRVIEADTGRMLFGFAAGKTSVRAIAVSPDGKSVVCGTTDGKVSCWMIESGQRKFEVAAHSADTTCVAFSPCGRRLASGGWDRRLIIWNSDDGTRLHEFGSRDAGAQLPQVNSLAFTGTGGALCFSGAGRLMAVDTLAVEPRVRTVAETSETIESVAASATGKLLATADRSRIRIWDSSTGKEKVPLTGHDTEIGSAVFSADGTSLFSTGSDGSVCIWDVDKGSLRSSYPRAGAELGIATFRDGHMAGFPTGHAVRLCDAKSFDPLGEFRPGSGITPTVVSWLSSRELVVAGFADDRAARFPRRMYVGLWDAKERLLMQKLETAATEIRCIAAGGDATVLIGTGKSVVAWNVKTGKQLMELASVDATSVAVSPDARVALVGCRSGLVEGWRLDTRRKVLSARVHGRGIVRVACSASGRLWASAGVDGKVMLWNSDLTSEVGTLGGHADGVSALAFGPDGRFLASGGRNSVILIWGIDRFDSVR
jgi:WD40 repeat protein